jgi:hypothetical protein
MTKRDFFRILIKLLGLYLFIRFMYEWAISVLSMYVVEFETVHLVVSLFVMAIWMVIFWLLLFKTDGFIKLLALDKKFDEERIDLSEMKASGLMKIGLIVIGALLFINNLSLLLFELVAKFKAEVNEYNVESDAANPQFILISKVILGAVLVFHNDWIVKYLMRNKS